MKRINDKYYITKQGLLFQIVNDKLELRECKQINSGYLITPTHELVHRLVYKTFVGEIPPGYHIHHKDHNKQNNAVDNLELIDPVEHQHLHHLGKEGPNKGRVWSQVVRDKISETTKNRPKNAFGAGYVKHYGYSKKENKNQYLKELRYYQQHNKYSWE